MLDTKGKCPETLFQWAEDLRCKFLACQQRVESQNKRLTSEPRRCPNIGRKLLLARAHIKTQVCRDAGTQQQLVENILSLTDACVSSYKSEAYDYVVKSTSRYKTHTSIGR